MRFSETDDISLRREEYKRTIYSLPRDCLCYFKDFSSMTDNSTFQDEQHKNSQADKIALFISYAFNAPIVALYAVILLYMLAPYFYGNIPGFLVLLHSIIFMLIFPLIAVVFRASQGNVDLFVTQQEKRPKYFIVAIIGYLLGSLTGFYPLSSFGLVIFYLGYAAVTFSILIINNWEKASVHVAGVTGPVTVFCILLNPMFIVGYLLVVLVAWSRLQLNAHTPKQVLLGFGAGLIVTAVVTLFLMFILPF